MKKLSVLIFAITATTLLGCFGCNTSKNNSQLVIPDGLELIVVPGEHWLGKMKFLFLSMDKTPQVAAWIEDGDGNYIATITVTNRSAKKNWISSPKQGRPEALPVWFHRQENNQNAGSIDAVSTATPKGAIEARISKDSLISGNTYNVYLEINHSFDYNGHWTENNSGDNGQPSLIYHAQFTAGQPFNLSLTPIGFGSVDGSNSGITNGLENITTALYIIKSAYFKGD